LSEQKQQMEEEKKETPVSITKFMVPAPHTSAEPSSSTKKQGVWSRLFGGSKDKKKQIPIRTDEDL
jgi:hypothetical protein